MNIVEHALIWLRFIFCTQRMHKNKHKMLLQPALTIIDAFADIKNTIVTAEELL